MKKTLAGVLSCIFLTASFITVAHADSMGFADVGKDAWYYNAVEEAYTSGLINGKDASSFCPDDNLTYAEAVKLAACLYQKYMTGSVTLTNGTPWYQSYVDYCKINGIISRDYLWNREATRAGYMEIFANALPAEALKGINTVEDGAIPDVPMTYSGAEAIYKLYRAGILQGSDAAHSCKPSYNITRSEVAAILVRMMNADERLSFRMEAEDVKEDSPVMLSVMLSRHGEEAYYNDTLVMEADWEELFLSDADAQKYPELNTLLNNRNTSVRESCLGNLKSNSDYLIQMIQEGKKLISPSQMAETYEVCRADSNVVSLISSTYLYGSGAAHGNTTSAGYMIDPATGQEITLADVVKDLSLLPRVISECYVNKYDPGSDPDSYTEIMQLKMERNPVDPFEWVLNCDSISILFQPYEMGSGAEGVKSSEIFFCDYPDLFREAYTSAPEAYIRKLTPSSVIAVNPENMDEFATVNEWYEYDPETSTNYIKFIYSSGDTSEQVKYATQYMECYLVHLSDTENYFYLQLHGRDESYMTYPTDLAVLRLKDGKLSELTVLKDTALVFEEETIISCALDPENFRLRTADGAASYCIGKNGIPEKIHD